MTADPLRVLAAADERPASGDPVASVDLLTPSGRGACPNYERVGVLEIDPFENRLRRPGAEYLRGHADHRQPADRAVGRCHCLDHRHNVGSAQFETAEAARQQCTEQSETPQLDGNIARHPAAILDFLRARNNFRREIAKGCEDARGLTRG
jgi:hypothetical protein